MIEEKKNNVFLYVSASVVVVLLVVLFLILNGNIKIKNISKTEKEITSIKFEQSKDYIYDATYSSNNTYTEFKRYDSSEEDKIQKISNYGIEVEYTQNKQHLSNLKVPYININSDYAQSANKSIQDLYIEYANQFDTCALAALNNATSCAQILTYRTYRYNDILSVVIIDSTQLADLWLLNYKIYNFDLKTGNKVTYNEMLEKLGYDVDKTLINAKGQIKNKIEDLYSNVTKDFSSACYGDYNESTGQNDMFNCYDKAYEMLQSSINKNNNLFFVNNDGILNLFVIPYYNGVQNGDVNLYLVTIEK